RFRREPCGAGRLLKPLDREDSIGAGDETAVRDRGVVARQRGRDQRPDARCDLFQAAELFLRHDWPEGAASPTGREDGGWGGSGNREMGGARARLREKIPAGERGHGHLDDWLGTTKLRAGGLDVHADAVVTFLLGE